MSSFIFYPDPEFNGHAVIINDCGLSVIPPENRGSYKFEYDGQTARAFNNLDASGVANRRFDKTEQGETGFGWQSVFIDC